jgi:YVTN family beta-propeller protein
MKKYVWIGMLSLTALACKKDPEKNGPAPVQQSGFTAGQGVFITGEGNFNFGNAKVSYYNFSAATVTNDVFRPANGRPLGDVCQGMTVCNGRGYIVVNNSGKIEVVNMSDFKSVATISGFNSPRYLLQVSPVKAYVTDLYANAISILDLTTNHVTGTVSCYGWAEEMEMAGTNVYVANHRTGKVYVISTLTDVITDSIPVSKGANSIVPDHAGKLWVLCGGESSSSTPGGLYRIDPADNTITASFPFPVADSPWRLNKNAAGDTLYYLNHGVNKMAVVSGTLPSSAFIPEGSRNFYGLGIRPATNEIYVSDAIDYVQSGKIYIYSPAGAERSQFLAGIIPGDFLFY